MAEDEQALVPRSGSDTRASTFVDSPSRDLASVADAPGLPFDESR